MKSCHRWTRTLVLLFAAVFMATGSQAQQDTARQPQQDTMRQPQTGPGAAQLQPAQVVLSKMHQLNQMEMQAGQMAQERGSTELMRRYGERLFLDHRFGDNKVTSLASTLGIELLPLAQLPGTQKMKQMKQTMQQLKQAEGQQFDKMFLQMMIQSHEMAIPPQSPVLSVERSQASSPASSWPWWP